MAEPIKTKRCYKCKQIKPISEFYQCIRNKDGHQSDCKICRSKYDKEYRQTENGKDVIKCYNQSEQGKITRQKVTSRYKQTEKYKINNRIKRKRYRIRHPEKTRDYLKSYCIKYPERIKAGHIVNHAITAGKLPRPDTFQCHYCPAQAKHYHHPDYSKPLDVVPACIKCHKNIRNITPILCV